MIKDKSNTIIEIGDIVKIENSPIKADNATYVVAQDGTSKSYTGTDLTLYKVAKHKEGYSLSKSKYNIAFYPLCNFSNKYKFSKEEMNAATIEILIKANSNAFNLVKNDNNYENEETENTYFRAEIKKDNETIEDVSYSVDEKEKMIAFFSNITLKQGETIEIIKQDHTWGYYYKNISYKLESTKAIEEVTEVNIILEDTEITELNGLNYIITEDTDTRDNSKIYVVKVVEKLDRDEYLTVNNNMKSIGGYYSRFKHGFIFKEYPTELLNNNMQTNETSTETEDWQPQSEAKKSIDYEIEQSQHTKTKEDIWLVKIKNNLSKDDFAEVKRNFATLKGFYSSFNNSFIFKYDPTEKLQTTA